MTTTKIKPVKVLKINLYSFDQLSDGAKQTAIENYRNERSDYFWQDENRNSIKKFAELFNITLKEYFYGDRGEGVSFVSSYSGEVEELTGVRLATWLYNNIGNNIFKPKYYNVDLNKTVKHNRVKCVYFKSTGNTFVGYYSAITKQTSCPLTGYCMDDDILQPIYEFLKKPNNNTNLLDLLESCFDAWVKAGNADIDYQNSDEFIIEEITNNELLFTLEGIAN